MDTEMDVLDVLQDHVNRDVTFQPGSILVEGPTGWDGYADGLFYHWYVLDTQDSVPFGAVLAGFSITVESGISQTGALVNFTEDPLVFTSVFATGTTSVPTPEPASISLMAC